MIRKERLRLVNHQVEGSETPAKGEEKEKLAAG